MNWLKILFLFPFLASAVAFVFPAATGKTLKRLSLLASLAPLALLAALRDGFIGAAIQRPWLPALSIEFHLSVDALSLLFLFLTAVVIPVGILAVRSEKLHHPNFFYGLVFLLEGLLFGFFTAQDLALFTLFWEAMLLPLYFMIATWGGAQRRAAATKFLIYMIAGSVFMVAAVLALYFTAASETGKGTFDLVLLAKVTGACPYVVLLFAVFVLAFAVKTPLFPFHAWLPDAYCQAPMAGTILLSAILSKAGIYGFLRIGIELFPAEMQALSLPLLTLAVAGVLYGGLAACVQKDFKRLIAYSSFSHVNFVLAGIFAWHPTAHAGAVLQALNHGVTIAGLFLVAGWLENRLGSTAFGDKRGLAKYMPQLCWLTLVFVLSSLALPGTNNFVGEVMVLFGLFKLHPWMAAVLGLTVILTVVYLLRWMQKVYFETPARFEESWVDIKGKEILAALPLVALIFWIGIYPAPLLKQIEPVTKKVQVIVRNAE